MSKPLKILILEDRKTDLALVKRQVQKVAANAIFTIATNGSEFIERINWGVPDIILSDYNLPDYNGVEALLLAKEKMPHVPFVFITGMLNSEEEVATAILQGASGYILKDNLKTIPDRLPAILEAAKERQEAEEHKRMLARKTTILLQKMEAILQKSSDFEGKKEIVATLAEIRGHSSKKKSKNA